MKHVELQTPREKMLKGLDIAANAVGGTLGPKGRNAFIDDPMQPRVTNDGKTIAENITLEDPQENMGAWVVKNTSAQTNDDAGDGTTTTTVLLQEAIHEALKRPENAMEVAESMRDTIPQVIKLLKAKKVDEWVGLPGDIKTVALTSTEDEPLAEVITKVVQEVGKDGSILVDENVEPKLDYEIVNGYEANVGFLSPYFANVDGQPRAEFANVAVLCSEKKIATLADISPIFEKLKEKKINELVIVCEDIDNSILGIFVQNKIAGRLGILVVKATGPLLQDISMAVDATPISESTGITFDNFDPDKHLGQAQKVVSTEKKTVFLADNQSSKDHADRLQKAAEANPNKWEAKKAMERVAKLRGGMAVIRVGAPTTLGMAYLKDKADDAVRATQAALEEGVVEGGGMTLWRVAQELPSKTIGQAILKRTLTAPLRKICANAGKDYTEIVAQITKDKGYNAKTDTIENLIDKGVIDPLKVERCAFTNAIENAAKFITTHATITDIKEKK